jgi:mRNA interferase RelE/StbE
VYRLQLKRSARKEIRSLHPVDRERVAEAIRALRDDPRPPGCKKLKEVDAWSVRVGDYRVIYDIDDEARLVMVIKVGHRRDVYRDLGL